MSGLHRAAWVLLLLHSLGGTSVQTLALGVPTRDANADSTAEQLFHDANALFANDVLDRAEHKYRRALDLDPGLVDARCNLGSLLQDTGRPEEAMVAYRQVLATDPSHADASFNMGVLQQDAGLLKDAAESFKYAVRQQPNHAEALANLGSVYQAMNSFQWAIQAYEAALQAIEDTSKAAGFIEGDHADMLPTLNYALGTALDAIAAQGRPCRPGLSEAECERKAVEAFQRVLMHDPDHALAQHALSAHTGDAMMRGASKEYVTKLFDEYAASFDESLAGLGYAAPQLLASALEPWLLRMADSTGRAVPLRTTLDAGCGTGLMAPLVRNATQRLVGNDLSQNMVGRARQLGLYDQLVVGDTLDVLSDLAHGKPLDLVVAADVFVYSGDLAPVFRAVASALAPGGLFAFTAERITDDASPNGWALLSSGRFAHRPSYLTGLAAEHGLSVLVHSHVVPRLEMGREVPGQLLVLGRL